MQRAPALLSAFVLAALLAGAAGAAPLERRFEGEGAAVVVSVDPGEVSPERDCEAVVRAEAEPPREARLPGDLAGRFEGFDLAGSYADEDGAIHLSLVPRPGAPRWRVKPFAVTVDDGAGRTSWFATEPFDLPAAPALRAEGDPAAALRPARIGPGARAILRAALWALAGAALVALVAWGALALRRARKVRRMSPKERALRELDRLLARDLPAKGRFKDFYVELTLVVRRYVERRHGIRAPRRTTEEFLAEARRSSAFDAATVARLGAFLEAADLVKFAGARADEAGSRAAADRARDYLAAEAEPERGAAEEQPRNTRNARKEAEK